MAGVNGYILGRGRFRVVAPIIVVESLSAGEQYVRRGTTLPADVAPSQLQNLLQAGLIAAVDA